MAVTDKGAVTFWGTSGALVRPALPSISDPIKKTNVDVSFTTSPLGATLTYAAGSSTYVTNANYTSAATAITFTPKVFISDADPIEYEWDFGDGIKGWGTSPTHQYKNEMQCQAVLCVTDSLGRKHYARRAMYIVNP